MGLWAVVPYFSSYWLAFNVSMTTANEKLVRGTCERKNNTNQEDRERKRNETSEVKSVTLRVGECRYRIQTLQLPISHQPKQSRIRSGFDKNRRVFARKSTSWWENVDSLIITFYVCSSLLIFQTLGLSLVLAEGLLIEPATRFILLEWHLQASRNKYNSS